MEFSFFVPQYGTMGVDFGERYTVERNAGADALSPPVPLWPWGKEKRLVKMFFLSLKKEQCSFEKVGLDYSTFNAHRKEKN